MNIRIRIIRYDANIIPRGEGEWDDGMGGEAIAQGDREEDDKYLLFLK